MIFPRCVGAERFGACQGTRQQRVLASGTGCQVLSMSWLMSAVISMFLDDVKMVYR